VRDCETSINVIKPVAGKQAAVTFGVGVNSQEITNALDMSGLFTIVAAASKIKSYVTRVVNLV
jgi:hypothetical protein